MRIDSLIMYVSLVVLIAAMIGINTSSIEHTNEIKALKAEIQMMKETR